MPAIELGPYLPSCIVPVALVLKWSQPCYRGFLPPRRIRQLSVKPPGAWDMVQSASLETVQRKLLSSQTSSFGKKKESKGETFYSQNLHWVILIFIFLQVMSSQGWVSLGCGPDHLFCVPSGRAESTACPPRCLLPMPRYMLYFTIFLKPYKADLFFFNPFPLSLVLYGAKPADAAKHPQVEGP